MNGADLIIVTPLFFGEASGSSVYYQTLARLLRKAGVHVAVISDGEKGDFSGQYYGLFPPRSGRARKLVRDYISYAVQNILYFRMVQILLHEQPRTVVVHTSFYNKPGLFGFALALARNWLPRSRFVADVRDRLMPRWKLRKLRGYDAIIACSGNIRDYLSADESVDENTSLIPVVQDPITINENEVETVLAALGLAKSDFILYVGALKKEKAADVLLQAFARYVRPRRTNISLVIVGLLKTSDKEMLTLLESPRVSFLGNRSRHEVLCLMQAARLCVNISPGEGMPRASLEALALRRPILLPPNVPEFETYCPEYVVHERDPEGLGRRIVGMLDNPRVAIYPVEQHLPVKVMDQYFRVLNLPV